jgi:hypothetical protein
MEGRKDRTIEGRYGRKEGRGLAHLPSDSVKAVVFVDHVAYTGSNLGQGYVEGRKKELRKGYTKEGRTEEGRKGYMEGRKEGRGIREDGRRKGGI